MVDENKNRRILCAGCEHPILADELGGLAISKDKHELWFHNALPCILGVADMAVIDHAGELRRIGKEMKHGRPTINPKLTEPPFTPESDWSVAK